MFYDTHCIQINNVGNIVADINKAVFFSRTLSYFLHYCLLVHRATRVSFSVPSSIMFGDLKSAAGVKALNEYLAENSYIEG